MIILGRHVTITDATSQPLVGIEGVVVSDDHGTVTVQTPRGEKRLTKTAITLKTDGFIIEGSSLAGTHATRAKR